MVQTNEITNKRSRTVKSSVYNTICQQRESRVLTYRSGPVELTFIRNFSHKKVEQFELSSLSDELSDRRSVTKLQCFAPFKSSFIALGNYTTLNRDIHLVLSATPIHIRGFSGGDLGKLYQKHHHPHKSEVWIAALAGRGPTEMAFRGHLVIQSAGGHNMKAENGIKIRPSSGDRGVCVLSVPEGAKDAFVVLASANQAPTDPVLHIIFLGQQELSTLYCYYDNRHGRRRADGKHSAVDASAMASSPKIVTWGSYNALYDPDQKTLTVESTESQKEIHILSFGDANTVPVNELSDFGPGLALQTIPLTETDTVLEEARGTYAGWVSRNQSGLELSRWQTRTTDFSTMDWKECPRKAPKSDLFENVNLDYHFTSGHILYRAHFKTTPYHRRFGGTVAATGKDAQPIWLKLNSRHRVIAYVNGVCVGSHMTYSRQLMQPGAKMGYDPASRGTHKFLISTKALEAAVTKGLIHERQNSEPNPERQRLLAASHAEEQTHEIILVIDSLGLSRQPFVVDDIRNPRGLLSARVEGKTVVRGSEKWQVAGVDVRGLDMAYESTGFPDEHESKGWRATTESPSAVPDRGVTWWRTQFEGPPSAGMPSPPVSAASSSSRHNPSPPEDDGTGLTVNVPLCCRIRGEFSAMIILNNVLIGRYFGSDSPQHDFYLMDGLIHKSGSGKLNELKVMIYGSEASSSKDSSAHIQILPWIVEDAQGEMGQWSGNTMFDAFEKSAPKAKELQAGPFWTMRQSFALGSEI